jgi:F-type H+-transporting ATPase subunit b
LAGFGLSTLMALGFAGAASAQETPGATFADTSSEECHTLLEEGKKVDACQEAPSPILPATNELIWGAISFTVVFVVLSKLAYPAIRKGMEGRAERIRGDIATAEEAKAEAQHLLTDYQRQLADAKNEAGRIIEEARQTADAMRRDLQARAESDIAELRQRAAADVEAAKLQAIADLRAEVAELAVGAAEVIVQHSLDRDTQMELIENYINQVGSQR